MTNTTPPTTKRVPMMTAAVTRSSRLRKMWDRMRATMGVTEPIGEATTTGTLLRAKNIDVTPSPDATPDRATNRISLRGTCLSSGSDRNDIGKRYNVPNRRAMLEATNGVV